MRRLVVANNGTKQIELAKGAKKKMENMMYLLSQARMLASFTETIATQALHYIYENQGTIDIFLDNYGLAEDFYDDCFEYYDYFGFDRYGEEKDE